MNEMAKIAGTPVPAAEIIPVEAYISEDYARAERDKLWRKVWLQAGRVEDLPEVGSYITYDILDDSVLIIRARQLRPIRSRPTTTSAPTAAASWSIPPRASATPMASG